MRTLDIVLAGALAAGLAAYCCYKFATSALRTPQRGGIVHGVIGAIGNTPLIRIGSLSDFTGCEILGKAEFLNPGGSTKDRVAMEIFNEAFKTGQLKRGGLLTEGSVGSTGISLAMVALAFGCRCFIAMPDDAAIEKSQILTALGAEVQRVRPVSITHPDHFVNVARRRADEERRGAGGGSALFADQFENPANWRAHLATGEEIWRQTRGRLHAFVSGAGTGGTLAGVSRYLKQRDPSIRVYLADPPGSSLYNKVKRGVLFAREEAEGRRLRNPVDTVTEGVGLNRLTANFAQAAVDDAFRVSDAESAAMAAHLLAADGLFVGSSSALNCAAAVKAARRLGPGHVIVTVLCDGGQRHLSKFHCRDFMRQAGLEPQEGVQGLDFIK